MITGTEFIQLANRWSVLPAPNGTEAVWRTAIGRAYYGAFHIAQDFLLALGARLPAAKEQRSVHQFVQMALHNSKDDQIVKAASLLYDLGEYRKDADYELAESEHGRQKLAQQCHCMAGDVRDLIVNCDAERQGAIQSAVRTWQQIIHGRF